MRLLALGAFRILAGDRDISESLPQKAKGLLIYVARARHPVSRELLAELLWEDQPPARSSGSLRMALSRLREAAGDMLDISRSAVEYLGWTDANAFEDALRGLRPELTNAQPLTRESAETLDAALRLVGGDFLHGFYVAGSAAFDGWQSNQREALRHTFIDSASLLVEYRLLEQAYAEGLALATRVLSVDPLREETHRQIMRLHAVSGDRAAAIRQYETCRQWLDDELGVEPDDETSALYEQILSGEVAASPRTFVVAAPPPAPETPLHNLPARVTSFIGRDDALESVVTLLENARLVTLVGPGGIGKTQLALETARRALSRFGDGAYFVDLAPARHAEQVADFIRDALGLRDSADTNVDDGIKRYFSDKHMLLVLDNFEHLLDASALVDALLRAAPNLSMIVTSREPLNLYGEHVYAVPALSRHHAAALFRERALAARPSLVLDDETTTSAICERLEGLPLALELAAGQAARMSLGSLLNGLDNRLMLLRTRARNLPARQQTLYGAIDWSYELLAEPERAVYRRLSVFLGGWTADAALAVCDADALVLDELVDKSLLRRQLEPVERYRMLEMIREHASAKLAEHGETDDAAARHAIYYYHLAQAAARSWRTAAETEWFDRLDDEIDNLRAALNWLDATPGHEPEHARMVGALGWFWYRRNYNTEAIRNTWRVLARYDDPDLLADALAAGGHSAYEIGDLDLARAWHRQALAYYQLLGDRQNESFMTFCIATHAGDSAESRRLNQLALEIAREVGDISLQSFCLYSLGVAHALIGQYAQSIAQLDEALAICRAHRLGYDADFLAAKAFAHLTEGDLNACLAGATDAQQAAIGYQLDTVQVNAVRIASRCLMLMGRLDEAEAAARDAYELAQRLNYPIEMFGILASRAAMAALRGDHATMKRLYREAAQLDAPMVGMEVFERYAYIAHMAATLAERGHARAALDLLARFHRSIADMGFVPGAMHRAFLERAYECLGLPVSGVEAQPKPDTPLMPGSDLFAYAVSLLDLIDSVHAA